MKRDERHKKSFILYTDYLSYMEDLDDEEVGVLMRAVFNYENDGQLPEKGKLSAEAAILFKVMKSDLDRNDEKYSKKLETLRENGKKAFAGKCQQMVPDNDNVNVDADVNVNADVDVNADANANVDVNAASSAASYPGEAEVRKAFEELIGKWNSHVHDVLFSYKKPPESIIRAIGEAADHGAPRLSYIKKILEGSGSGGGGSGAGRRKMDEQALLEMRLRLGKEGVLNEKVR